MSEWHEHRVSVAALDRAIRAHIRDALVISPMDLAALRTGMLRHGPNLVQQMPPWYNEAIGDWDEPWRGLEEYTYGIPCLVGSEEVITPWTVDFTSFLDRIQNLLGSPSQQSAEHSCSPKIHRRPIIAATAIGKHNFVRSGNALTLQLEGQTWVCDEDRGRLRPLAPLDDWASTTQDAVADYDPRRGSLYLVITSSAPPEHLRAAAHARAWRREHRGEQYLGFRDGPMDTHVCSVFVHDRQDWPRLGPDGLYSFDRRAASVYIYNPSFREYALPHLRRWQGLRMVWKLIYAPHVSLCSGPAPWIAEAGRVLVGGGGNRWGMCAAMSANWMQKTAYLYREVSMAIEALKREQTTLTVERWQKAERAWTLYFRNFRVVNS